MVVCYFLWQGWDCWFLNIWIPANTWNNLCDLLKPCIMLQHLSGSALKGLYSSTSNTVTAGSLGKETPGILLCWFITSCIIRLFFCFVFLWRVKVCTKTDGSVNIHPKSVNVEETEFHYNWLVYHLKMRTSSVSQSWACGVHLFHYPSGMRLAQGAEGTWTAFVLGPSCPGPFLVHTIRLFPLWDWGIVPQIMN